MKHPFVANCKPVPSVYMCSFTHLIACTCLSTYDADVSEMHGKNMLKNIQTFINSPLVVTKRV
jgi:hypothetical protein